MSKRSGRFSFAWPTLSGLVLFSTAVHLALGLLTHIIWLRGGGQTLFHYYFAYEDPLFFVLCTGVELLWARMAWKQFLPGQDLRGAWLLIMMAALCHVVGMILTQVLCTDSYINPLYALHFSGYKTATAILHPLGMFIGGPVHMAVLAGGLLLPLRLCRTYGVGGKLKAIDWIILTIVIAYTLRVAYVLVQLRLRATAPPRLLEVMNWANDPLLCVLLGFAFFLRRSVAQMGWGYVTKCWGAYVVAIFGTSLGSMGQWATNFGILPYPENTIFWHIWPVIYAAYALAPIYQVEAAHVAKERLEEVGPDV
jgi:hypothetical protein